MSGSKLQGVVLGLTITSTWGNGHATTYRALLKEMAALGHHLTFLERNVPWYESNREFEHVDYCDIQLYGSLPELKDRYAQLVRKADFVIVGSYVPDGIAVGEWVIATAEGLKVFYDIDTPVTLAHVASETCEYLVPRLVPLYDLYLSFTGGPTLTYLQEKLKSPDAQALYCSVDPALYYPEPATKKWDLAYLGTYAEDRQPALQSLLLDVAGLAGGSRFAVAGPQYPDQIAWPSNVERIEHLPAREHRTFYNSQKFTLNLTRRDMVRSGFSPSVRLFESAACGVPILTDEWPGLGTIFAIGSEIFPVRTADDVVKNLQMSPELRMMIGMKGRERVLRFHTAEVRARELQSHIDVAQRRTARLKSRSSAIVSRSETHALI